MGDSKQEEISFTYQFLKYAVDNCKSDIYHSLAWGYAKEADDAVKEFCTRIILPFVNYIEGYLTEIGIQLQYALPALFCSCWCDAKTRAEV